MLRLKLINKVFHMSLLQNLITTTCKKTSFNDILLIGLTKRYKFALSALSEVIESGKHFTQ